MSKAADLTTGIIDHIYKQGGYAWRASSTGIFEEKTGMFRSAPKKGVADVLGLYKGKFMAIEVKIGKDRMSDEQIGFMKNISYYGGLTFTAKDLPAFIEWFNFTVLGN